MSPAHGATFASQVLYGPFPCFSIKGEVDPVAGVRPMCLKKGRF